MNSLKKRNSDLLPTSSAFGTDFSDPEWINTLCIGSDEKRCATKFKDMQASLRSAPSYKTLTCIIRKNMSTVLQALMCFLFNEEKFKQANRIFTLEGYKFRLCWNQNEYTSIAQARELLNLTYHEDNDWLYLAPIRDPIERFTSAYVDKCIRQPRKNGCNGCFRNMTCFVITEYERIMESSVSEVSGKTYEDLHFFPQAWNCNFSSEIQKYKLLNYSSVPQYTEKYIDDLFYFFRKQKVSEESLKFIRDQLTGGRTVQSTVTSDARMFIEKRLRSSPFLMEYIIRMYYWDYKLLGFQLPTF